MTPSCLLGRIHVVGKVACDVALRASSCPLLMSIRHGSRAKANLEYKDIIENDYAGADECDKLMSVVRNFTFNPALYSEDELPFMMAHSDFIGTYMHKVEFRPERAFATFVPLRLFALRRIGRMLRSLLLYKVYGPFGVFDQKSIIKGARRAFQIICQSIHKNSLNNLVERDICNKKCAERFDKSMMHMSAKQHELFNLTENDVISVAPGVLGAFQNVRLLPDPANVDKQLFKDKFTRTQILTYSVLCCAFYKKQALYNTVAPILASGNDSKRRKDNSELLPKSYGFAAPRLIFGYLDFMHVLRRDGAVWEIDPAVKLFDFQFVVL